MSEGKEQGDGLLGGAFPEPAGARGLVNAPGLHGLIRQDSQEVPWLARQLHLHGRSPSTISLNIILSVCTKIENSGGRNEQLAMKLAPDRKKFMEVIAGNGDVEEDMRAFCATFHPLLEENHRFLVHTHTLSLSLSLSLSLVDFQSLHIDLHNLCTFSVQASVDLDDLKAS